MTIPTAIKPIPGRRRCFERGRQHVSDAPSQGPNGPAWSKNLACADAPCAGTGRSRDRPFGNCRRSESGRRGAVADDARSREVRLCHSSWEADEQSGLDRRGAGGAKGRGQGECEPAKHAPDAEPGKCVTGAGAHTASRNEKRFPVTSPKVGAVCPNWARTVLCGGRSVMSVPTAISEMSSQIIPLKGRTDLREARRNSGHRDDSRLSCAVGPSGRTNQAFLRGVGHGAASLPFCGRV